jgi:hypothetical protein
LCVHWHSPVRRFFLSDEEKRREISSLLYEWSENQRELKQWRVKAKRISDALAWVAGALRHRPEDLVFPGDSMSIARVQRHEMPISDGDASDLNLEAVKIIRDAIRTLEDRKVELAELMKAFNLPVDQ